MSAAFVQRVQACRAEAALSRWTLAVCGTRRPRETLTRADGAGSIVGRLGRGRVGKWGFVRASIPGSRLLERVEDSTQGQGRAEAGQNRADRRFGGAAATTSQLSCADAARRCEEGQEVCPIWHETCKATGDGRWEWRSSHTHAHTRTLQTPTQRTLHARTHVSMESSRADRAVLPFP